jgi:signal transduction histidine kinase
MQPPDVYTERMRVLLTLATMVSRSLEPQEVAETALWLAVEAVDLKVGVVLLLQEQRPSVLASHGFSFEWLRKFRSAVLDHKGTIIERVLESVESEVFSDLRRVPDDVVVQRFRSGGIESLAGFPLRAPGDVLGVMLIGGPHQRMFHGADLELLEAIASQISASLRNAWLFSQSWRQLEELEAVTDVARAVVSSLDLGQILSHIMEAVMNHLNTEAAALLLLDPVQQELEFAAVAGPGSESIKGVRLKIGKGVVGWVAEHDQPLLVPDVMRDARFHRGLDKKTATVTRSILCVPLRARERLIGVVEVINKRRGQFTSTDQRLLESLATFAAIAIENLRLYEEARLQTQQATLYAQDLSLAYQQERKQREALDRLRYSFLNVVGHELKTPLTVILQGLEVLKDPQRGPLNTEQTEVTSMLEQQSSYLGRVIDGLITFAAFYARQGTMQFSHEPFAGVLDDALLLSQFKAERKKIVLEDLRQDPLPSLSLDKDRMSEAITHLIDNAIKFSPEESTVVVETDVGDEKLTVRVIDQGCGISPSHLGSIWDSFVQMSTTLERGLEGLGLGLAIARYIVEAHNGEISVESELGEGSTFTICLPCDLST